MFTRDISQGSQKNEHLLRKSNTLAHQHAYLYILGDHGQG